MKTIKVAFAALAIALLSACSQIDTGNVGVQRVAGQIKDEVLPAGWHITGFNTVTEAYGKEALLTFNDMHPLTSDKITMADVDVDIYVQINTAKAKDIVARWPGDISSEKGEDGDRIGMNYVYRQARETIYKGVAKFKSDTIHNSREALAGDIVKGLQDSLDKDAGQDWFFVRSANIRSLLTDPALEASIKEAAKRDYQIAAKQKDVELAKAEADRKRVEAQGEADRIRIQAQAISSQGGDDYVRLQAIAKWDGKLPTTTGGAVPFINVK